MLNLHEAQWSCGTATTTQMQREQLPPHKCNVNHFGSSGSMESKLALSMVTDICKGTNGAANVGKLVTDNVSTMRANIKHKSNNNKDKLDENIPEPIFLADPGHRVKVMVKNFLQGLVKTKTQTK